MPSWRVRQGDHGVIISADLADGAGGVYAVPVGTTVTFIGVERPDAPRRDRRPARTVGGAGNVDSVDAYRVSYTITAADSAHVGVFDIAIRLDFSGGERETWPSDGAPPDGLTLEITAPPGA